MIDGKDLIEGVGKIKRLKWFLHRQDFEVIMGRKVGLFVSHKSKAINFSLYHIFFPVLKIFTINDMPTFEIHNLRKLYPTVNKYY